MRTVNVAPFPFPSLVTSTEPRCSSTGRRLSAGPARVLRKLARANRHGGLRRTYEKTGNELALSGLITDGDLARHGYMPRDEESVAIGRNDSIHRDRDTCWTSEWDGVTELWVGEPL
jgi:hypothetical protein